MLPAKPAAQIVPRLKSPLVRTVNINERPSCKYRTICIEGSCSVQHVCDLIDWMAKHSMNGYFIQFNYGTIFFRRWYEHRGSNVLKAQPIDAKRISGFTQRVVDAIIRRGMSFERMGHGWTCAALGITGEGGWDKESTDIVPPQKRDWLAQVNAKRELWGGVALNTNLNYGNPAVRSSVVDAIVAYAREHPEVNSMPVALLAGRRHQQPRRAAREPDSTPLGFLCRHAQRARRETHRGRHHHTHRVPGLRRSALGPERSRMKNPGTVPRLIAPDLRARTSRRSASTGHAAAGPWRRRWQG